MQEYIERYQMAMNKVYRGVEAILKDKINLDITADQFSTLHYIYTHDLCTSSEMARELGISKSAVTAQVNRLVKKELIYRDRDDSDRRNVYLYLTEAGVNITSSTEKALFEEIGKYLGHFDENEIAHFISLLEKLAALIEHDKGEA